MSFYVLQRANETCWVKAVVGKRHAALLFGDIAGTEPLSDRFSPDDLLKLVDGYRDAVARAMPDQCSD
jgi:class 3 adenylate cyclase